MNNTVKAYAKINLSLDIVSKREDGYHNLRTVMHSINLYDELSFIPNNSSEFRLITESKSVPSDKSNIIIKACMKFFEYSKIPPEGFDIYLKKNIPVCAGLGGGSTDGAATIKYLNEFFGQPLQNKALYELGRLIGADVPFCIKGGTCLCEGIGEILTPLPSLPDCFIVLAKPSAKGLSTKKIFSKVSPDKIKYHPDTEGIVKALKENDIANICKRIYNVLEEYSIPDCREIETVKNMFTDCGAAASAMSGSGSSVFAIFYEDQEAQNALEKVKKITTDAFIV